VDFEKAFDKVWRDGLWCKLLLNNINGKMYKVIYNMYQNIKSRIVYNNAVSDFFDCNNGVRQGENLSPFLFSIYLNDLEQFLNDRNVNGLTSITEDFEIELDVYLKLFVLYTLSKAFSKSTNVTNNFFFFNFNNSKKAYRTKILSIVE
jgi:hypothetical protein